MGYKNVRRPSIKGEGGSYQMEDMNKVRVWEETVVIPTYGVGEPNKNPVFAEKRVYQGSSGKVYPYPVIEKIYDEKEDKEYKAVFLENRYIKVMILPELGGRIQRAYDKTNGYDFVYYNHVIKPALVGLVGPWISGGIEFNWPQHHRPTTFMPVDHMISENKDGSATVLVNDVDQMYGTKGIASFTLYPDKAYIEIRGQLYNRTPLPQTFLWWANPAVPVNDNTQSIFPPDVHAVMDHGKRDVSRFPIATGVYYKHDYSEGVDISRYKNIPVPTSYMAEKSSFDFVGGYDYGVEAGILHVADHHISPGKKQWTWGCGDFGKAWDRNLTDEDGPYVELMTGVFTDNQPDFTWLKPFEEKTFKQYFMPYKAVGAVKNASIEAAMNLELHDKKADICIYATSVYENAAVVLKKDGKELLRENVKISPVDIYKKTVDVPEGRDEEFTLELWDESNGHRLMLSYSPLPEEIPELPHPAEAAKAPEEIMTNEELYLTGLHIEQYRHATYLPDPYYLEGLKRDPSDIRINIAYGSLLLTRGCFKESEKYFRKAIKRLTWKNPNPYDSEAYYKLGLTLFYQGRKDEAFDAFYKACWSNEQQEMSFYFLAAIETERGNYESALDLIDKGLVKNWHNVKARGLKALILRRLGRKEEAEAQIAENLGIDRFDYVSRFERYFLNEESWSEDEKKAYMTKLNGLMRDFHENFLQAARDYAEAGAYCEAVRVLRSCSDVKPMLRYYEAYYLEKAGKTEEAMSVYAEAEKVDPGCCFPNKLEDIAVLSDAKDKGFPMAAYYLGDLWYDKKQYEAAKECWETAAEKLPEYPTVWRNLSLVYFNKTGEKEKALKAIEKAFELDTTDARVFLELDQLRKKLGYSVEQRIAYYEEYKDTFTKRDDLYIEYVTLKNFLGKHEEAYELLMQRRLHPWEGGEGKALTQYETALLELGKKALKAGDAAKAVELLEKALLCPECLGEGKLEGTKDNHIYYHLGLAYEKLGDKEKAEECFRKAVIGTDEPAGMMFYYDQPADMIMYQGLALYKLGRKSEGNARQYKLIDYGEQHIRDEVKIDYFAVSLPDMLIYDEDWSRRNRAHCLFLMGLGNLGLGNREKAEEYFEDALKEDNTHLNCRLLLNELKAE